MNQLVNVIHTTAREKGWWDEPRTFGDVIALCHSELSEALEAYRDGDAETVISFDGNGKPLGVPIELADTIIRILDYCGYARIDIDEAIKTKIEYNTTRPHRHGGKKL